MKKNIQISKKQYVIALFVLVLALFLITFYNLLMKPFKDMLDSIEMNLYDARARLSIDESSFKSLFKHNFNKADKSIILLDVDDYALRKLADYSGLGAGRLPWERKTWANVANFVNKGKPRIIVYDIMFAGNQENILKLLCLINNFQTLWLPQKTLF